MTQRRGLIALAFGAVGLAFGVIAAMADEPMIAVLAGVAALAAGVLAYQLESDAAAGGPSAQVAELEEAVAAQVQARMAAEDAVRSLGEQLADAERRSADIARAPESLVIRGADDAEGLSDPTSGLFNEEYYRAAVDARIAAARRHLRPVAVAFIDVVVGVPGEPTRVAPEMVADCLARTLRDSDTAARLDDGRFALVLEDTPENGAIWTIERVRRMLAGQRDDITLWAGVACYPAHGFDGGELLRQADVALLGAREWHQDRIEVATAE